MTGKTLKNLVVIGIGGKSFIREPFNLIDNYTAILSFKGMEFVLPLLVGTQLLKLVLDFTLPKKYLEFTANDIMVKPYVRIFIQQFTVILAMFFIIFSNAGVIAAILFIIFRTFVDS